MLGDAKAEVARLTEVALAQLVLLDLEAALEDFLCLGPADGDVDGDLLVAADAEGTDGEACFAWEPYMLATISSSLPTSRRPPRGRLDERLDILYTGVCPLSCSSTLAALVNLSPDSPTEMLRTSFWIRSSRMGLLDLSLPELCACHCDI